MIPPVTIAAAQPGASGTVGVVRHTRGPWTIAPGRGYGSLNGHAVYGQNGLVLAVAIGDVPDLPVDANARVIAMTPDLMVKAAALADICDRAFAPSHAALALGSEGWVEGRQLREAVDAVRAVLRQAAAAQAQP